MRPGEWRDRAKRWLLEAGFVTSPQSVHLLAETFRRVDREGVVRGERQTLDLVARHIGTKAAELIAEKLAERAGITSSDDIAQRGEDVADEHRATAPAERG